MNSSKITSENYSRLNVTNLWYSSSNPYSVQSFTYHEKARFTHRGVAVYTNARYGSYDYVIGGAAIAQRNGFNEASAPKIIDEILDGEVPVSDAVALHLKGLGFKPLSFTQYSADVAAGRRE